MTVPTNGPDDRERGQREQEVEEDCRSRRVRRHVEEQRPGERHREQRVAGDRDRVRHDEPAVRLDACQRSDDARAHAASRQCAPVPAIGIVRRMAFKGWPAEAISFYEGLEADNSKTYWAAHKDIYESAVVAPFRALSDEIEDDFGPLRLFRPHRDVRFSKDKSPYKTAQGAVTESEGGAIYYVSLAASGFFAGSGYYRPAPDQLARMREAIDDPKTGPVIERAVATARKAGYEVGGDSLKTAPKGYPKDHPRDRPAAHEGPDRRQGLGTGEVDADRQGERSDRRRAGRRLTP